MLELVDNCTEMNESVTKFLRFCRKIGGVINYEDNAA